MDVKKLISDVKSHEIIYNTKLETFSNSSLKTEIWRSIGRDLNEKASSCRSKWYELLQEFVDLIKSRSHLAGSERQTKTRKWEYEDDMSFLLPYLDDLEDQTVRQMMDHSEELDDGDDVMFVDELPEPKPNPTYEAVRDRTLYSFDIMEKIFWTFTLKDQNTFRLVCHNWYNMAHEYWKNSMFDFAEEWVSLKNYDAALAAMVERPMLKKIILSNPDSHFVIECVIRFLEDVRHLEVVTISVNHVKRIVKKFKNLKSISLSVHTPNLLEIVCLLAQCPCIENFCVLTSGNETGYEDVLAQCYRVIADGFPSLKNIGTVYVMHVAVAESLNIMLRKKCATLTTLNLVFHKYCDGIYDAVNLCTNLENLRLELNSSPFPFELSNLRKLNHLTCILKGNHSSTVVLNTFHPAVNHCWLALEFFHLQLNGEDYNLGILDMIFSTLRSLKQLILGGIDRNTSNLQLQKINNLTRLHTLVIKDCTLTESSMRAICENESLKCLKLSRCNVTVDALITLRDCESLEQLILEDRKLLRDSVARSRIMIALRRLNITWLCSN